MADSQRKTANLFDKDNTTIYSAYFDTSGSWLLSAESKSVKMPCQPNTQYTLSVPNSLTVFRVYESNNASIEPSSTSPPRATEITRGTNISQYTFTTSSTAQIILFQGSNGAVTEWFNGLMLNTGSTALPYEPYGWLHSLRKLTTATDTLTTLPADIYADGQTIGVNLLNTTDTQQTFPNGTYYIYSNSPDVSINYYDSNNPEQMYAVMNDGDIFTPTGSLVVFVFTADKLKQCMVAKSSTAVPFQPYTNCTVKGNMQQTGTPTPSSPIQPSECGDRTGNLLSYDYLFSDDYVKQSTYFRYYRLQLAPNTQYTIKTDYIQYSGEVALFFGLSDTMATATDGVTTNVAKTITTGLDGIAFIARRTLSTRDQRYEVSYDKLIDGTYYIMLNEGSEALSYEPYGYKLDIKSANTTTPVYLGEVETERNIYKIVLTGQESWGEYGTGTGHFYYIPLSPYAMENLYPVCSHFATTRVSNGGRQLRIYEIYESTTDFTTYLQQQYAAGTPVCVWYVLATETTGILNEPLRKIGDYADTVSGITIPTITGKDTFDVLTTLKPSEVSLSYTGWHDANVKESDGSEWQ